MFRECGAADDSDIACAKCETVVGYHIAGSKPCDTCSRSNHNAHYHLLRYGIGGV